MAKVMVVDDSPFIRLRLAKILSKRECKVVEAGTSKDAVNMFKKEKPDFVLLDIIMPEGEEAGVGVLKKIMNENSDIPVVMLTAVGYDEMINDCKEFGAKEYLVKPFNEEEVLEVVDKYLGD